MITPQNLATIVQLAKSGQKPTIAIGTKGKANEDFSVSVTLQEIQPDKQSYEIGQNVKDEDVKELPSIELKFYKKESLEVLIIALQKAVKTFESPMTGYPFAC